MIMYLKFVNYCKPNGVKLLGVPGAFDDETDGELLPCPLCGRIPEAMVRTDSIYGYFAAVSCFGERNASHAYVSAKGHADYEKILHAAINEWNNGVITIYDKKEKRLYNRQSSYFSKLV